VGRQVGHHARQLGICTRVSFPFFLLPSPCSSPFFFLYIKRQNKERVIQDWGRGEDSIASTLQAEVQHQ